MREFYLLKFHIIAIILINAFDPESRKLSCTVSWKKTLRCCGHGEGGGLKVHPDFETDSAEKVQNQCGAIIHAEKQKCGTIISDLCVN